MLKRLFTHCMLRPGDVEPMFDGMTVIGAFNPGVIDTPDGVVLLVRICEAPTEQRDGQLSSPRFDEGGKLVIDWFPEDEQDTADPRWFRHKVAGSTRLRFISYLRIYRSRDGKHVDGEPGPVVLPEGEFESYGIEDPRITRIGDTCYITYVAVSVHGVATALMSTTDFVHFERHGIIFPPENKDVVLFPDKVLGQYLAMHRPVPLMRFIPPEMWLARSPDLVHWGAHAKLLSASESIHNDRIGGGTPPIRVREGFLTIYHGSQRDPATQAVGIYTAAAMLLDADNPQRILAQSRGPIMVPEADFETGGFVDSIVFPTALIERGDELWVYYGAADANVGVTAFGRAELLAALA